MQKGPFCTFYDFGLQTVIKWSSIPGWSVQLLLCCYACIPAISFELKPKKINIKPFL